MEHLIFDMIVFFAGAFSSEGSIDFSENGMRVHYRDRFIAQDLDVSSYVPIYAEIP